jgi:hypothetical protein
MRWLAGVVAVFMTSGAAAEPVEIESRSIPLQARGPELAGVGALEYRGGVTLSSGNSRFGGLSGLSVESNGTGFVAITDTGLWLTGRFVHDADGRLEGIAETAFEPLRDSGGRALKGKQEADSESLTALAGGGFLVSIEGAHRILRYAAPGAPATEFDAALEGLSRARRNGGLEAIEQLADGRVLALTEDHFIADGRLAGWLIDGDHVSQVTYPGDGYFKPTGLTVLDDGRILVLERGYTVAGGAKGRIMLIDPPRDGEPITVRRELARFQPPIHVDNFEGLAAHTDDDGGVLLYIVSDDNFNPLQRTLLMMFRLRGSI